MAPNRSPSPVKPAPVPVAAWLGDAAFGFAVALCTLLAYAPALRAGFMWDDDAHVTRPDLQTVHGLFRIWFEPGATQQYYPVLHSAFWIEHRLWGQNPFGYHLLNIVLHAAAAFLFSRILLAVLDPGWTLPLRRTCAYFAAALFALHPVGVESVAWISEQKNTLSAVCYLGAAWIYLKFERRRAWSIYAAASGCFALALLSKSVTATLPAALLVLAWWRHGRLHWRRDWLPLLPWLAVAAIAGWVTAWLERVQIGAQGPDFALNAAQRFVLAGRILWFYLGKLVWPANLSFVYPKWTVDAGQPAQFWGLGCALGLVGALLGWRKRERAPLATVLIFGGTLFPALGFFNVYPFLFSYVADHFQYLASLSVCALAGMGSVRLCQRYPAGRWLQIGAAAILLVGLGSLTHEQAELYRDSETLYRATLARNPQAWLAQLNLGGMLFERGAVAEARLLLLSAERLQPDYPLTHFDLGQLDMRQGNWDEAAAEFESALRLRPSDPEAHNNLGICLARRGVSDRAAAEFAAAIRLRPNYPLAHCNWGILLMQQRRWSEARSHFETALTLQPGMAEAQDLLRRLPE